MVIHGDADAIVPIEVSGNRTATSIKDAELVVIDDAPHGLLVSHAKEWNEAVIGFLAQG